MTLRVFVDRVDIDEARLSRVFVPMARRVVDRVAGQVADEAKRRAPRRTGRLRATIRAHPARQTGPFRVEAQVTAGRPARLVTRGARPHLIRARRADALHFGNLFARSVQHPGFAGRPFLEPAARRVVAGYQGRRLFR